MALATGVDVQPDVTLSERVLPPQLRRAIERIFAPKIPGVALVGGTALAGYYAGHRRSDDIDLFTRDQIGHAAAVGMALDLRQIGAVVEPTTRTPLFFHATAELSGHAFTISVVQDASLHRVGQFFTTGSGVMVPSLYTLFQMKAATLVSRCGEKDLYDLVWLSKRLGRPTASEWIELGRAIDGGLSPDTFLMSVSGSNLRQEACSFAEGQGVSRAEVFRQISTLRQEILQEMQKYAEESPDENAVAELIKTVRSAVRSPKKTP